VVGSTGSSAFAYAPALAWSPDSARLAFNFTSPTHPLDVWAWERTTNAVAPWTHSGLAGTSPVRASSSRRSSATPAFDDRQIPGL
jgi:hypothetical protein